MQEPQKAAIGSSTFIALLALIIPYAIHLSPTLLHADEIVTKIKVEDHSGVARHNWPVTGGLPLPKGKITDPSKIALLGAPTQTRVLSRWSDNSIKWVLLDYQVDLEENKEAEHAVIYSDSHGQPAGNIVTEDSSFITVDTTVLKFRVSKTGFSFIDEAWLDLNQDETYSDNERIIASGTGQHHFFDLQANEPSRPPFTYRARNLKTAESHSVANNSPVVPGGPIWMRPQGGGNETRYSAGSENYSANIRENGPLRTVIELKGSFPSTTENNWEAHTYSMLIHAYHGKPHIRVQHNFLFKGDPRVDYIRRLGLQLPLNFSEMPAFRGAGLASAMTLAAGQSGYLFNSGPEDVFHLYYQGFNLPWEISDGSALTTGNEKTGGWIDLSTSKFGVTAIIKDMAYLYPKELSYNADSKLLTAWLWPDHGNLVLDMNATGWTGDNGRQGMQGVSFGHDIFYVFHGPSDHTESDALSKTLNDPLQPYADPDWYSFKGTRAAGMIMPRDDSQFPKTEGYLATGTALIERSMVDFGMLGMLNYGDIMQDFSYNESGRVGTWGLSSRRDDYCGWRHGNTMLSYRMLMQYLRTGEYRYWTAADAHLRHVRDVLIKHYNEFRDQLPGEIQWTGMGRRHSAYWGAGTGIDQHGGVASEGYGTNWLGHYLHWNLTGDWRTFDVLQEIRDAWYQFGNNTWVTELCGSAFVGLKLIGTIPGFEECRTNAESYKSTAVSRAASDIDEWRDGTWFFGYSLYLQDYTPDPAIVQALIDYNSTNPGPDQWGLYWHRDSLSAVYWAAEGNQTLRDSIYQNLLSNSTEQPGSPPSQTLVDRQWNLYSSLDTGGLFSSDIDDLVHAVTNYSYWRIKDDMIQLQWDEPLSMAVIDHYRNGFPDNRAPLVAITSPADKATLSTIGPITFSAIASDNEEGDLSGNIVWNSSIDGNFSSPAILSAGTHTITASVADSGGLTGTDTISLTIRKFDFDTDNDVDGADLSDYIGNAPDFSDLSQFSKELGRKQ